MSIKQHDPRKKDSSEGSIPAPPVLEDGWAGSWGSIAPSNQIVGAIRICKGDSKSTRESFSYPYHVLTRWHWQDGDMEELEIQAGKDAVIITGHGLGKLVDALDRGRLQKIIEQGEEHAPEGGKRIHICSLTIEA